MARLLLNLSRTLGLAEAAALPEGVTVDNGPDGATVQVELPAALSDGVLSDGDLAAVVALIAALARALPTATLSVQGQQALAGAAESGSTALARRPAAGSSARVRRRGLGRCRDRVLGVRARQGPRGEGAAGRSSAATAPAAPAAPARPAAPDAWELVAQGRFDDALAELDGTALDSRGRDIVRELAASTDPAEVALSCRIAAATDWKSFVSPMRRLLDHADTRVRVAAIDAIGQLGGPAMSWQLEKRSQDPSPEVQAAVVAAMAAIEARQG